METWKFIKEEPKEDQCYDAKSDYYDTLRFYSTFGSGELYDVDIKSGGEFVKTKGTGQDPWETVSSYFPKLSIPLVRLEYMQNKEIIKYLKPLNIPEVTASTKLQLKEEITELDLNLKMECVELKTLNNNTLMQSPKHDHYALPSDFVSAQGTCDPYRLMQDTTKMKLEDKKEILEKNTSEKGTSKKKYIQQTLNFGAVLVKCKEIQTRAVETVKLTNSYISKTTSKLQLNQTSDTDSDTPAQKFHRCNLFNGDFLGNGGLTRHMFYEHNDGCSKKEFVSKVSGKPHARKADLRPHSASYDPANWYTCKVCNKKFKKKEYLRQHIRSHADKKYDCDICQRSYRYRSTLIRHMMKHIAGSEISSDTGRSEKCETQLESKKSKKDNKETTEAPLKRYECDVCGTRFENKSSMKVHIEFLHIELLEDTPGKLDHPSSSSSLKKPYKHARSSVKKRFPCHTCPKSYTQIGHLRRHEASHLPNASQANICNICERPFTRRSSLSRHMLNAHDVHYTTRNKNNKNKHRPPKDFECKICGKAFRNRAGLRRHSTTHDARKPYECDICKKRFTVKGNLYMHILTHDNWKPYPCDSCQKLYRRKSSLQRHIKRSHSDEKIHKCNICSKSFKFKSTYCIHIGRFHPSANTKIGLNLR